MVSKAKGDIIVFNNADAIPQDNKYLANLVAPLKDSKIDCVFGQQIPRVNAFGVVKKDYERAFGSGDISKKWGRFFSLVSSGFRKDDLIKKPFNDKIQYSEDSEWVNRHSARIVYVASAIVEHSHNYSLKEVEKRFFNEGVADRQMGKKSMSFSHFIRSWVMETLRDWMYLIRHRNFRELFYSPIYRYVQKKSYYRGTKL
jgi:rhamnosyltransferase